MTLESHGECRAVLRRPLLVTGNPGTMKLLVDELDKSETDVPNDLLSIFEDDEFAERSKAEGGLPTDRLLDAVRAA
ncbi:hypothetical protein [Amycolatopsis oliviviridis]|uniref:hypothetical protein n=1 Tax=Amycolatopsis oliviviridis TaxID=1471590 RepID=UPI00174BF104|nr:hypothetical protein [Amycolatopsis oliviviridis]